MNETQTTLTAQSLANVLWIEDGKVMGFPSKRLYGVTDGQGRWGTFNGTCPGAWALMSTAAEIAATVSAADLTWIEEKR